MFSDHAPITFKLLWSNPPPVKKRITFRQVHVSKIDIDEFKSDIKKSELVLNPPKDVVSLTNSMMSKFVKHMPHFRAKGLQKKPGDLGTMIKSTRQRLREGKQSRNGGQIRSLSTWKSTDITMK